MPKRNSSVVGREFGNGVRDAIERNGLTQRKLAELLDWQEAKVSDLVQGKGGVSEADVVRLLSYCRVPTLKSSGCSRSSAAWPGVRLLRARAGTQVAGGAARTS